MINVCYIFEKLDDFRLKIFAISFNTKREKVLGYINFLHNWKNYFKYLR